MASYKLASLFNKKAGTGLAALVLTGALSGCATPLSGLTGEPLLGSEKNLTHNVFGHEKIDTAIVRKYFNEEDNQCSAAKVYGPRHIMFYKNYHSDDYSNKSAPYDLGLFIHEMTHIWQAQNWSLFKQFNKKCRTYSYELTENSRFDDFCNEQQAAMVQDYARYFLTADPVFPTRLVNNDDPQALLLLKNLVERTFPSITAEKALTEQQYPDVIAQREGLRAYRRDNNVKTVTKSVCS